jgi:hypothetical protein
MVLAGLVAPGNDLVAGNAQLIRRLAAWAAVGFALSVPLQTYGEVKVLKSKDSADRKQLEQLRQAVSRVEAADSEEALRAALNTLSGSPTLPGKFGAPVSEVKTSLLEQIRPQAKRLETRSVEASGNRWEAWLKAWLKDSLQNLLFAMAFASIGQAAPGRSTLLQALFSRFRGRKRGVWGPNTAPAAEYPGDPQG